MRKLLVHAGAGKTGTSALQVFFDEQRGWLKAQGIDYPPGPFPINPVTRISSGNGLWLAGYLKDGTCWDDFAAQLAGTRSEADVLLSSELLAHAAPERVAELRDRLVAMGFDLQVFYLVRNLDEWFLSAYQQLVKRHGCTRSFAEFCDWYPCEFSRTIKHYEQALGPDAFRVLSYESGKSDLVDYFVREALGVQATAPHAPGAPINRSLTAVEVEVFVAANTLFKNAGMTGNEAGKWVARYSDAVVSAFPSIGGSHRFAEPMPASAVDRLGSDVAMINSRLGAGHIGFSVQHQSPALSESDRGLARVVAVHMYTQAQFESHQKQAGQELRAGLVALGAQSQQYGAELKAIRNSTSWRVTAPMRRISARLRSLSRQERNGRALRASG